MGTDRRVTSAHLASCKPCTAPVLPAIVDLDANRCPIRSSKKSGREEQPDCDHDDIDVPPILETWRCNQDGTQPGEPNRPGATYNRFKRNDAATLTCPHEFQRSTAERFPFVKENPLNHVQHPKTRRTTWQDGSGFADSDSAGIGSC